MNKHKEQLIAVVGVSEDATKYGHKIFADLLEHGYAVVGINHKGGTVLGTHLFASLRDLPEKPSLVIIVVPPTSAVSVLETCVQLGIPQVWMQPGSESQAAREYAEKNDLQLTTNACFMTTEGVW